MKKKLTIFILLFTPFLLRAQVVFNTVVPQRPVVSGESFQVQYIFREAEKIENFKAPVFAHFRFVSGPNQYNGSVTTANGVKPLRNFVYTLEAISLGRFIIPGAVATVNGKTVKSNDAVLEVISKAQAAKLYDKNAAANSDYVLRPGEDPYEKIRQNLFLKLVVDRTSCFAGEPVLAIFKLYSRLESNSDIVKNPGFYGFTVYDMVNLADKQSSTERLNGKTFDVHTIREVQLYPLQAGTFSIDVMEIKNKIEFSHSSVNKKTEQQIVEGMQVNDNAYPENANTEVFETSMHTEPVAIRVMPVPAKNKPITFNGAVGAFAISASVLKDHIAKNEEGVFEITISGHGNFTQLNAPSIDWPDGMEGFEPVVRDSLDKTKLPLAGSRRFRYAFICNQPGLYHLPVVNFSFFDSGNHIYKTVSTIAIPAEISKEEKKNTIAAEQKESIDGKNKRNTKTAEQKESIAGKNAVASRVAAGIVVLLVLVILFYWINYKKEPVPAVREEIPVLPSTEKILGPAYSLVTVPGKEFYTILHQCIWKFFGQYFNLSGSEMNKQMLAVKMHEARLLPTITSRLILLIEKCESGIFTDVAENNQKELLEQAESLLAEINSYFLQQA